MNADNWVIENFGDFNLSNFMEEQQEHINSSDDELLLETIMQMEVEPTPPVVRQQPEEKPERFATVSEVEIDELVQSRQANATKRQTNWSVKQFKAWLSARALSTDFEVLSTEDLDSQLRRFYAEVRTADGSMYSRSTYNGIRSALNRHIRSPPFNRSISLMDNSFHKSNQVFKATLKKLTREGLDRTTHHGSISDGDLKKLRESEAYRSMDPRSLQRRVWFDLTLAFGRRGCENIQKLKKDAYIIKYDDTGREYVEMKYNEQLKNHQGEDKTDNIESRPRMYASKNSDNCPVATFKHYLSKLNPENEFLFQQVRRDNHFDLSTDCWYTSRCVGEKTISSFMPSLSEDCVLSKRYTNHCVRATTVTKLSHAGVSNRAIIRITKHRDEKSLKHYETDSSEAQKRMFSDILNGEMIENVSESPKSTMTNNTVNEAKPQHSEVSNHENLPPGGQLVQPTASSVHLTHSSQVTNVMHRENPHFVNPYAFNGCNVTIQNHFHYH